MTYPRLEKLRLLYAVVDHGSFRCAAERTGATPPGVSRAVRRLEERLGVTPQFAARSRYP